MHNTKDESDRIFCDPGNNADRTTKIWILNVCCSTKSGGGEVKCDLAKGFISLALQSEHYTVALLALSSGPALRRPRLA